MSAKSFLISALSRETFEHLFPLSPEELLSHRARRVIATKKPGFPCRVSLEDAEIGEEIILVNYEHQNADTPFQSTHAIYVRPNARQIIPKAGEVPELFRLRTLSLRAFDHLGMLTAADLAEGSDLERGIEKLFAGSAAAYIHIHFAKPGCYAARVDRA